MSTDTLVKVEHLYRYYGHACAVEDVSFEISKGEVLGFLGPNGAGKSTTMQIISGNLAPSAGRVLINGVDVLDEPKKAKAHLGYLPEQPPVYRELTVDEYLKYCTHLHRIAAKQRQPSINKVKERCGLGAVGHRLIGNLSKGFQQRVGIAQAIIHSPAVVILDEPTVGLDPIQIREIRSLIRELGGEHSVILSTHILPEVQAVCDRVQIINKGKLVMSDTIAGLQLRMQASSLTIGLRNPPAIAALQALENIKSVEDLSEGRFRLHYLPNQNPAEQLADLAVRSGCGLRELIPERMSLEEIFVDITTAESPLEEHAIEAAA